MFSVIFLKHKFSVNPIWLPEFKPESKVCTLLQLLPCFNCFYPSLCLTSSTFCLYCCFLEDASSSHSESFIFSLITCSLIDFPDFLDWELELELNNLIFLELPDLLDCSAHLSIFLQIIMHRMFKGENLFICFMKPKIISFLVITIKLPMILTLNLRIQL